MQRAEQTSPRELRLTLAPADNFIDEHHTEVVYQDAYVKLSREDNRNGYAHCYHLKLRAETPIKLGPWWFAVFFRKASPPLTERPFEVVLDDEVVRLIKFGRGNPDYMLTPLRLDTEHRAGDPRFATSAAPHPIERDESDGR